MRRLLLAFAAFIWLAVASLPGHAADTSAAKLAAAAGTVVAQNDPPPPQLEDLRKLLDAIPAKLPEEEEQRKVLTQLSDIATSADQLAKRRTEELAEIDRRLTGLGPAPEKDSPADAPDVAEQRRTLNKQRSIVDSDLRLARLISVDAGQRADDISRQRRAQYQAALTARVASPFSFAFWHAWKNAAPDDWQRLQTLGDELGEAVNNAVSTNGSSIFLLVHLLGSLALIVGGAWVTERILVVILPKQLPSGRLRRTLLASLAVVSNVLIVGVAVKLAWSGLQSSGPLTESLEALEASFVRLSAYGAFVVSLGHALLATKRPSWRLLPISDELAHRLKPFPWWIAVCSVLGGLMTDLIGITGWSLASEVVVNIVFAGLAVMIVLFGLRHLRATPDADFVDNQYAENEQQPEATAAERPFWFGLLAAASGFVVIAVMVSIAFGFVALAATMARQLLWTIVVISTMYLLFKLAEDLCEAVLSSKGIIGAKMHTALGLDDRLLDQVAVITSGVLRVALFFYMIIALMAPLGTGPDEVFRRGSSINQSLSIGDLTIAPQALLTAALVVCFGFIAIRMLKRWLTNSYFPNTSLEPGMRSSITTLMGYVGAVAVVAVALAGLGISVERIAWVASALSVGIGFGLQAIVQNFISGLILLAERPVKVGDWVILGDTEGDVRRVNVRATEIQLADRSTVVVPNSEFITKTVRNMTLAGAPGRVLLRLPAPLDTDAPRMREIILKAYTGHPLVLETPAPLVQLEGIQNGTLTFLAIGYIGSPRNTGGVRSDLLFEILKSLRDAGLYLSPPATTSVSQPATVDADPITDTQNNSR